MRGQIRTVVVVVSALAVLSVAGPVAVAAKPAPKALPPGCRALAPVVAYHPGALEAVTPTPKGGPVPCGMSTGFGAVESRIAAGAKGVVFNPATAKDGTTGVAYSTDQGGTWHIARTNGGIDDNMYADPDTGRIFWVNFKQGEATAPNREVDFSDDGGASWTVGQACCLDAENSRLVTAKAPKGHDQPTGYHNVVYVCSDTSLAGGVEFPAGGRVCSKSLDGGVKYSDPMPLFSKPVPQHSECLPYGEYFGASDGAYPEAGPDGVLYVMVHCGIGTHASAFLASSDDEAASWKILGPMPDADEMRVDSAGNIYAALTSPIDDGPILQISTDTGKTWSKPVEITPPRVTAHSHHPEKQAFQTTVSVPAAYWPDEFSSYQWFMDVKEPGHIAFAFYGIEAGNADYGAWIAESRNALAHNPLYRAAAVIPASTDVTKGAFADEYSSGNEHIGLSFAPDGSPWASFTNGDKGLVGRLYWPR